MERLLRCCVCGKEKPTAEFWKMKSSRTGFQRACRPCQTASRTTWDARHPERKRAASRRNARRSRADLRSRIFSALGGKCAGCGVDDARVLDIDHKNGGGTKHRKRVPNALTRLRSVLENLNTYRLLCKNCNWLAYLNSKEGTA